MVEPVSVTEAGRYLDGLRSGWWTDQLGAPLERPLLVVDLAGPAVDLRPPPGLPCVLVGVSDDLPPAPHGLDLLITAAANPPAPWVCPPGGVAAATAAIEAVLARRPIAATTLVQVLRISTGLPVPEALVVESLAYAALQAGPEHHDWLASSPARKPDTESRPAVVLEREGDRLDVILDRPERRNAYSARMRDDLVAALELAAADDSIREVHLRGRGPSFCSGGDLAEFGSAPDPATAHSVRTARSAAWWIERLRLSGREVIAHTHGACVGAGTELAAFASTVLGAGDATFRLPEVDMGLIPGAGGTASLPRRVGRARAAWMALSGTGIDVTTAQAWGLVDDA